MWPDNYFEILNKICGPIILNWTYVFIFNNKGNTGSQLTSIPCKHAYKHYDFLFCLMSKVSCYKTLCVNSIENIWAMGDFQLFPWFSCTLIGYFFSTGLPKNQASEILANLCRSFHLRCVQIISHPNMIALPVLKGSETITNS